MITVSVGAALAANSSRSGELFAAKAAPAKLKNLRVLCG